MYQSHQLILMDITQIIGILAGILTATSLIPQLIKILKEKKADDVSPLMLIILLAGLGLWATYGIMKNDWPLIVTNSFSFLLNTVVLFLRFRYSKDKKELFSEKGAIEKDLALQYSGVSEARGNFLAETDGSGGTGKVGIKDIAIAKRDEYQKLDKEYQSRLLSGSLKLNSIDSSLKKIEADIKKEEVQFAQYLNNGFLTRIEALNNLLKNNKALQFRYYLIVFILMLIELMPVIAKTMLPSGSYDEKVMLREEMEIDIANSNIRKEQQLKELYNQMAFDNDADAITQFFALTKEDRYDKIRALSKKWKEENHQSYDGFWERVKRDILTKQEN